MPAPMGFLDRFLGGGKSPAGAKATAYDPVCGMTIDPAKAAGTSQYQGKTVHFCSAGCKQRFDADPRAFAAKVR